MNEFYNDVYNYHQYGGLCIALKELYSIVYLTIITLVLIYISQNIVATSLILTFVVVYLLLLIKRLISDYSSFKKVKVWFDVYLHADRTKLSWAEVANLIVNTNKTFIENGLQLPKDEAELVNLILKRENYIIGMVESGVLDINFMGMETLVATKSLEWITCLAIFSFFFTNEGIPYVRHSRKLQLSNFIYNLKCLTFISIIVSPIVWIYLIIFNILKYAQTPKDSLLKRVWTNEYVWKFRHYNELNHVLVERLEVASQYSDMYNILNTSPTFNDFTNAISFISGSIATVLFFNNPSPSVMWWIGVLSFVSWNCKMSDGVLTHSVEHNKGVCYNKIITYTNYDYFLDKMYEYKFIILLREALCIILLPYVIWFKMIPLAPRIVDYIYGNANKMDGTLQTSSFIQPDWENAKVEKSVLSFVAVHEKWDASKEVYEHISNLVNKSQYDVSNVYDSVLAKSIVLQSTRKNK